MPRVIPKVEVRAGGFFHLALHFTGSFVCVCAVMGILLLQKFEWVLRFDTSACFLAVLPAFELQKMVL